MKYYISKTIKCDFEEAVRKVRQALEHSDLSVVSELDMRQKLYEKLHIDFRNYTILGICNPSFAYQALIREDKIGTMIPCNLVIQEISNGLVEIASIDPAISIQAIGNDSLIEIADHLKGDLQKIIESLY